MAINSPLNIAAQPGKTRLRKSLKLWQVVMMGLAYLTPMTVFDTFGIVSGISDGHVPASYLLALAGVLCAVAVVGSLLSFPVLGSKCAPVQHMVNILCAVVLGPWYGALSQLVYVALGLVGLPIFTQGGGIGYLMQPTCGFLIGLIPAAWVIGRIAGRKPEPKQIVPACLLGYGVLYAIGVPYMALILNTFLGKGMGFSAIMWAGMIPFLPGDMIKILCITLLMPPILRQLDKLDK